MSDDTIATLRSAEIFSSLEEKALHALADASEIIPFGKGARIFEEGAATDAMYVVAGGRIAIERAEEGKGPSIIAELLAGDSFGEMELMNSVPRAASASAMEDSALARFPRRGLELATFLEQRPEEASRMLHSFMTTLAGRIRRSNALVKENSPWVQELRRQAYGDKLTGLYNKAFLEERFPEYCSAPGASVGLLMFKPDNFKEINDTYGHEAGDGALQAAAAELKKAYGEEAPSVRYLGNELAVVLPGKDKAATRAEGRRVMELMGAVNLDAVVGVPGVRLRVSVGAGTYPEDSADPSALIALVHELPLVGRGRGGNVLLFPEDK